MATSAVLDGLNLNAAPYTLSEPLDFGVSDAAATFLTGDLRPEEYDQYAAELRYVRQVTLPFSIRSGTLAQSITDTAAVTAKLAGANRYAPKDFVFTPNGGNANTFKVIGGSLQLGMSNQQVNLGVVRQAQLVLDCYAFIEGAVQNLGSSGAPLVTNTASPAAVTLSPSPAGDVPGKVILFVKNRSASAIRSLFVAGISGNTSWTTRSGASSWTTDTYGSGLGSPLYVGNLASSPAPGTIAPLAHFTAPTLPSDRPFRLYLRGSHSLLDGYSVKFRVRVVSGSIEVVGAWRSYPQELTTPSFPPKAALADMGAFYLPVGEVGQLGAQSTTVYIEAMVVTGSPAVAWYDALFMPVDGSLLIETADTSKTLAVASGIIRVESDQAYDNSGNPIGSATIGSHIRTTGGRYVVYASQGFHDTLDETLPYAPENVDIWASFTPRSIGLQ
jgi:hypothetical protein